MGEENCVVGQVNGICKKDSKGVREDEPEHLIYGESGYPEFNA